MLRCPHNCGPWRCLVLLVGSALLAPLASALILGGDTAVQLSPPADDPGWANVVSPNGCSGVYLGNQWVLTAGHVGAGSVVVGPTTYAVQSGSAIRLRAPDDSGVTDLALFRLAADPGLPAVGVIVAPLAEGTEVTMIGYGRTRGGAVSYDVNWSLDGQPVIHAGYLWGAGMKGWGTNIVAGMDSGDDGYGSIVAYVTDFTAPADLGATANEAQGATNDSGGGVFAQIDGHWSLAGIMVAIDTEAGQPGGVSVFGNITYSMELSTYRPQIEMVRALSNGYDIWQYLNFRGTGTDASADPDGDGFTNLEEYAYGLDPQVKNAATAAPQIVLATYGDGQSLTATFTHNTLATDVQVVVEASADLVNWTSGIGVTSTVSTTALGNNLERLVIRDLVTTAGAARRFLRVRVAR